MAKNQRDFRQFPVERLGVLWPSHVASSPQAFGWGESKSRSSCGVPGLNMPQPMSKILEMYTECVGNVLEMCPLKLILASWKGLGMQWFVYECVLAYYVSIKFLKFPTWTGWHRWHTVTYGDIWWGQSIYRTFWAWLSTEESTSPESDSGHLISLILVPVADFVFEANLLPNLLQLYFNCMKERERDMNCHLVFQVSYTVGCPWKTAVLWGRFKSCRFKSSVLS